MYVMLTTLTDQGLQTLRSNPDRLRAVNRDVEELGAKVLHQWACLGPFDFVNVIEAPDAATVARISVELGSRGSAKLQSYELMEIDEFLGAVER
ncbi:MAG TPA: GYD domain-containing protein [Planctomycetota bacterium]|nr:GYD domain-containing protein [Planctomycetota bacterium]